MQFVFSHAWTFFSDLVQLMHTRVFLIKYSAYTWYLSRKKTASSVLLSPSWSIPRQSWLHVLVIVQQLFPKKGFSASVFCWFQSVPIDFLKRRYRLPWTGNIPTIFEIAGHYECFLTHHFSICSWRSGTSCETGYSLQGVFKTST